MLIGEKIRTIRKEMNLTISALADAIEVTPGYISQIERDLIDPSLSVLKRLCKELQTPLSVLFSEESAPGVVLIKSEERTEVRFRDKRMYFEFLTPSIKDKENSSKNSPNMEVFYYKIDPKGWVSDELMLHEADECNYILEGEVEYHIDGKVYTVKKYDTIYIPKNTSHMMYNATDDFVEGIGILTPPMY
ncbi:helix-turn-helix transcriptional regulator [Sedimentibacter sp. zth1]|uniref:helix-turn-helix domain-containing protein n=1 Tax=Sedimentibacter sp. zth1 TaxID=2816908 RepID=UPI001A90F1B7|nr:XRE family transcriptional regulator [Sedimentibacter sp. zth1]QSX05171.1 helix-turn-helix transcriptional regulator [Sedimentibacter sp. zth1]